MTRKEEPTDPAAPIEDQIRNNLLESGFPLELETCSQLEDAKWVVFPNEYVTDKDDKQDYEIDVIAHQSHATQRPDGIEFRSFFKLIIECKKSKKHPWVFFVRKKREFEEPARLLKHSRNFGINLPFRLPEHRYYYDRDYFKEQIPYDSLKLFEWDTHGVSYTQAYRNPDDENQIYRAIKKVLRILRILHAKDQEQYRSGYSQILLNTYLPVIVVDGNLFEATMSAQGLKVEKTTYVPFLCNLDDAVGRVIIPIVQKDELPKLIDRMSEDAKILHEAFSKLSITKAK